MIINVRRSLIDTDVRDWLSQCSGIVSGFSNTYSFDADGTNEYLRDTASTFSLTVNNFTVCAWIKADSLTGNHCIASCGSLGNNPGWAFFVASDGTLKLQMRDSTGTNWKQGTKSGISVGTWYFVMGTFDESSSSGINVYIDGSVGTSGNPTGQNGNYTSAQHGAIGARFSGGSASSYFNGHIDNVAIWFGNTFTGGEVTEAYNGGAVMDYNSHSVGSPSHWYTMDHASDDFTGGSGQANDSGTVGTTLTPTNTEAGDQSADIP